jgi:uncharacterized protein YqjF (DUF2071 family)
MRLPAIVGTIDRRILINYQAEAEVIGRFLPQPFRPKLINGKAIVGICLIRLKNIRPKGFPFNVGISSENGAHRIAVEWTDNEGHKEGVYIPRRDTSSRLNSLAGGRFFPGIHHLAEFKVKEANERYDIRFDSEDGTFLEISAAESSGWNKESVFDDQHCASVFFKQGSVGYSPDKIGESFDGMELKTKTWEVSSLKVMNVRSSFFENTSLFPTGSIKFDNALLMRSIDHEWNSKKDIMITGQRKR